LLDVLAELESLGIQGSLFKVFEVVKQVDTQSQINNKFSSYSFSDLQNERARVDVVVIHAVKKLKNKQTYYFIYINDISDYLTAGLFKIQHIFQTTLTNGLSHERLTPLNGIILNTDLVLQKC
jgi:signal transduction histidine kinase